MVACLLPRNTLNGWRARIASEDTVSQDSAPRIKGFRISTAVSRDFDTASAFRYLADALGQDGGTAPDFVTLHYGGGRPASAIREAAVSAFGTAALHGGSSCLGVMTGRGAAIGPGGAIGALAIHDPEGAYGTAMEPLGTCPRSAAARAVRQAIRKAGRPGEAPDVVWLTASPGSEEAVLAGIGDVIGQAALIIGGSAADDRVEGTWSMFDGDAVSAEAVVVSAMFPSVPFGCAFESGYAPTMKSGTVTAADGRTIRAIGGRPAADVYCDWTEGRIVPPRSGSVSILSQATLHPLASPAGEIAGVTQHILIHPAVAHADGSLDVFADVSAGMNLCLMTGSTDSLVQRAARIVGTAVGQLGNRRPAGALVIYCGGCMLAVRDRMDAVAAGIADVLGDAPFLGLYTFGEQGEMLDGDARHANLMISALVFADPEDELEGATG